MNSNQAHVRQISELESILQQLVTEHQKLLKHVDAQQMAMRKMNLAAMDEATNLQEAARLRIALLDHKRKALVIQIGRMLRLNGEPKIQELAALLPHRKEALLKLRSALKSVAEQIATRNNLAGKLASALLGHLNTAVRLLAGAMEQSGIYNKRGVPQMSARIGVMEAVG